MRWLMRFVYTIILFAAWSTLAYIYVDHSLSSPPRDKPVTLSIQPGATSEDIGHLLMENGLIRKDWFFSTYSWLTGSSRGLQAGVYEIRPDMDIDDILDMITHGKQNTIPVTIPEGFTTEQIANRLQTKGINREEFLEAVDHGQYDYAFLKEIPKGRERRHWLEGYLYPSTYNIPKNAKAEDVVNMMLGQFDQILKKNRVMDRLESRNMTLDQLVNVASIVEREGQVKEELPKIAGVIYNRLDQDMRLQVDATVQYALGEHKNRVLYSDLEKQSPYNTYLHTGLPPGPISNPGEDALLAALEPEQHQYLYYVTKKDGSQEHYFAKTFQEHRRYIFQSKNQLQNSSN
ncbi:aminodeoxychorismate lyase [Marinithermofilum abyssi]|uniref:Endolytic murein transglycosylase n=1 Tax=Marinithermofilum abyssi TaxID=1571185 RepID=A0A8J2VH22_9BACL|nr:endolytic transglycosylase MltG [Marinithermofilum abyssi]GGE13506.1 aminodeoxychorismate lyase [Marinithermofilum abyssi]